MYSEGSFISSFIRYRYLCSQPARLPHRLRPLGELCVFQVTGQDLLACQGAGLLPVLSTEGEPAQIGASQTGCRGSLYVMPAPGLV